MPISKSGRRCCAVSFNRWHLQSSDPDRQGRELCNKKVPDNSGTGLKRDRGSGSNPGEVSLFSDVTLGPVLEPEAGE